MDLSVLPPDKQVKLQYWLEVIRQCRASGLTNQAWCEQHNISLKSYYYWIAKIRNSCYVIMSYMFHLCYKCFRPSAGDGPV